MGVKDWTIDKIEPEMVYRFSEAAKVTGITPATLTLWCKARRLCVYPKRGNRKKPHLTKGKWLIEAIRKRPVSLTDTEYKRNHRRKWPERQKARQTVTNAIETGKLIPQPCEICGTTKRIESHHDDYSKPLEVRWLCRKHHKQLTRLTFTKQSLL